MKVTREMIHPELRTIGMLMRGFSVADGKKLAFSNAFLDHVVAGKTLCGKLSMEQRYISRPDGTPLRICIYTPKVPKNQVAGLLWIHGGGYALGVPEQEISFIRDFIFASDCVVVSPDYIRSTEAPYPAALQDCYTALLWMYENCDSLGIRADKLMIGGDSAGGGLTAALSLYSRDMGTVPIAFQMPLYPMLDPRPTESSTDNDAPIWNTKANLVAWKRYLGDTYGTDQVSKYASPILETDYRGLPPTLTFVGSIEPFRDETITYVERLKAAGVRVAFRIFEGCFHGFDVLCSTTQIAKEARAFLIDGFMEAVNA